MKVENAIRPRTDFEGDIKDTDEDKAMGDQRAALLHQQLQPNHSEISHDALQAPVAWANLEQFW